MRCRKEKAFSRPLIRSSSEYVALVCELHMYFSVFSPLSRATGWLEWARVGYFPSQCGRLEETGVGYFPSPVSLRL